MDVIEATEGTTTFLVPVQDSTGQFPPGTAPVFFNRRMELNRDATVLLLSVLQPSDYLDAMGATGVRGLRVAHEVGIPVTINDRDPEAIPLIRENVARLGLPVTVTCRDACSLLFEQAFDAVDIDPFGTPAPFTDAGIRGTRRFLLLTATDTAPLCGAHLKAGIRRYFARPGNTGYHGEVGLRILLGFVARETVKYDRGIEPLFCFAREHFVRLNLRLTRGPKAADRTIERLGFILQCPTCAYREELPGMFPPAATCPFCGKPLRPIGPLFLGAISSDEILGQMQARLPSCGLGTQKELEKLLTTCREELPTSSHYDYHRVAQQLVVSPPKIETLLEALRSAGFDASRTHYSGTGVKTNAPLPVLYDAIRGKNEP
ncbi:tRNA (guanine-N(2)-)-methyltransferase [Methanoregula boonei 6A8]|jgi:tRNA (guanine26-N2/guanine27-N2)-dimethyltransferase|uniref:tRNA (guanine(26)-N(2))-dimethyltransferase n=1 Tax=Methanoregula boonei (strain DSM 21154 / JCM 14090 / 6A8) TaxID=456442 RepID=TRM1_METB6|nr:tRNA (guanine(10)-N(2))-dimethyltransferase [Methanoregula boonei]A7I9E9.1 RecName: Full=tRNA (guanine(26)-N(2))-dimethyltransferase; AltName: Full=tRNA 2,2-dimethylguanosine-26 methyltransferase; AltName: Full=tRNA(guanine-26,N(2)-N(2)) methyltransferase; AltName: Full=tRNA(m(2,2)G26)dimethyltransferase [Methanoregula boonei 6A8]ABS56360.1 tRNA (guanine-N(2)-)-methyltransferase [Methanoregula boonei 6A8]